MSISFLLVIILVLPFIGAVAAAGLPRHARTAAAILSWIVALVSLGCLAALWPMFQDGETLKFEIPWLPSLGVNLVLRLDGLSWLFSALILGIGALVVLYARYYMSPKDPVPRFFSFLLAFMGAMQGVVLSGNLIQLVVFWELTSLFSFLLIGYWHQNPAAREGSRMALTVTATGGIALLVGMILIGRIVGSYDLDVVLASREAIQASPLYLPALLLLLAGAMTKSAQFPFHFWLPRAMAAPTPVSAYLHSATMVKAGVFLLIRFWPVFAGTESWYLIVGGMGLATLLLGAWCAIFQHDLKGLLAYSTISHLGLIVLLLGLGSPLGCIAAIFHTVNHATFKASLFMAAGIIDHEAGTRDMRKLSGLFRFMPFTATLAMVAAAAMAGVPLLNGFLSKEMFLAEAVASVNTHGLNLVLPALATLASAFSVLYSLRFIHTTFFGPPPTELDRVPHEPPAWMRRPVEVLVALCLVVGIFPAVTVGPFLKSAAVSVLGFDLPYYSLALWHGFNLPLVLSLIALGGGVALYVAFGRRINANPRGGPWGWKRLNGGWLFERSMTGLFKGSEAMVRLFGATRQQPQLRAIVLVALLAGGLSAIGAGLIIRPIIPTPTLANWAFAGLWAVGASCAVAAAWQAKYHRLAAVVLMGGAGLASCLSFVWLSAPDLAVTQLLVEVVTTVLLLLGLRWLPKRLETIRLPQAMEKRSRRRRRIDLIIAAAVGTALAAIAYAVMTRPSVEGISRFFVEHAYKDAGGRNIVNVILVDFRAFDTFGEITVLGIVGLTVFALLRRFRPADDTLSGPSQQRVQNASDRDHETRSEGDTLKETMLIPRVVMRWIFPFIILLAVHLFLRGHDLPGGGFAAGVALSIAFVLQYMASGARWVEERLAIRPIVWIGAGLVIAALSGVGSWLFGYPFLTSWFQYADLPVLGRVPLASAVLFDLGVVVLVVGATVLTLVALAHQSLRKPKQRDAEEGEPHDGTGSRPGHRRAGRIGRLAAAAAPHLPGHHGAVAAVLCGQHLHLRHGAVEVGRPAGAGGRGLRPCALHRPDAPGAGPDGHRHQFRPDGPVPGGHPGGARHHRQRPCRRQGARRMIDWTAHLIIGPIVLPMIIASAMLLIDERRRTLKAVLSLAAMAAILVMALVLLHESANGAVGGGDTARVYRLGSWAAPYGIVLVADRLSTMMVALTSVLGGCALIFALARWDRAGPRFHALFLLLIMGVNGALLTGDLFNLFVFFEVMLAASYGLALHGSGEARVRAGVIYIAVNLTASLLFLIGVSLIYGVTGTLNMADLALRVPAIAAGDLGLFHIGAAVLGTAFLIKCAMWPVGFWLTSTYSAASAPSAAVFAILSKVGVYVIIRLSLLLFGAGAGASAGFGLTWLMVGGLATIAFGTFGLIASRDLSRAAGFGVMISSGTVLAILGVGDTAALSGALFYLIGSTLACAALFLLAEILQRGREADVGEARAVFDDEYRDPFDDEERNEPGLVIPAAVAALGGAFLICTLMVAGLPPLAGFVGKLSMIDALIRVGGPAQWTLTAVLSVSSLGALIGLTRLGVGAIWTRDEDAPAPVVGAAELTAVAGLLGACVLLAVFAGSALIYTDHTAAWLAEPQGYIHAVLGGGGR